MCGSTPAPLTAQPSLPSTVGAAGGGGTMPMPNTTTNPATTSMAAMAMPASDPATSTTAAGGPPTKLPTTGGGAVDGAANLQLQTAISSLVQALTALTELLKNMPATSVAGANGSGAAAGGPTPKGADPTQAATKVGGRGGGPAGCDMPMTSAGGPMTMKHT